MITSLQFGEFSLYPEHFELCRSGHILRLERKPVELLILLTGDGGRVVTRTEIAQQLWAADVFVDTEHGINTAVRKLRQALRDDPDKPRFIQTLPKVGYRFIAPVSMHVEPAALPVPLPVSESPEGAGRSLRVSRSPKLLAGAGVATACLLGLLAAVVTRHHRPALPEVTYEQLTDLTDAAVAPAVSPDGHTLAFIRGDSSFGSAGRIYARALPEGEIREVAKDDRPKYGLAFSPDGSRIAYTVFGGTGFATYTVSAFGGEDPQLLLNNAAGLSWLNADRLLFSEVRSGIHLGVVTGTAAGGATHDVYFPSHQRAMAHYSEASPDGRWVLVVEMDSNGNWGRCRVVALEGRPDRRVVGPDAACTAANWSADGLWMYFTASLAGQSHVWRQRFPLGAPQQITFGAADEEGLAVDRSSNSLITSIGSRQSALWIHDDKGERPLSSEGEVLNEMSPPLFRKGDTVLYFLLRRETGQTGAELRRVEPETGRVQTVLPGVSVLDYDVSPDGKQVLYSTASPGGTGLWLAPTDRSRLPTRLGLQGANFPHFGAGGKILFQRTEGNVNYLEQVEENGLGLSRLIPSPILFFQGMSAQGHWAMALVSESPESLHPTLIAIPLDGTAPRCICAGYCAPLWSSSGRFLYIPTVPASEKSAGRSLIFPVGPGERLPTLPSEGIQVLPAESSQPGATPFPRADLIPGRDPAHFAFVRTTTQRNLFRLSLK